MLEKIKSFGKKVACVFVAGAAVAQNAAAEALVTIPATATANLTDTITTNFPVVLTCVILSIACSLLIGILKKGRN